MPARHPGTNPPTDRANLLLLLSWPLRVRESDFRALEVSVRMMAREPCRFFEFVPSNLDSALHTYGAFVVANVDGVGDVLIDRVGCPWDSARR
jgi:hypothetical protein